MISIRPAVENDIDALSSFDLIAQRENERREFIRRVVISDECFVAVEGEKVIGYGVLNYTLYRVGCIDMLCIHSEQAKRRGRGIVAASGVALPNAEIVRVDEPF